MFENLPHTKWDFEHFPDLAAHIETAHSLIREYSKADWADKPDSSGYQLAHLFVCRDLVAYYKTQPELLEFCKMPYLTCIAGVIEADAEILVKEYSNKLN